MSEKNQPPETQSEAAVQRHTPRPTPTFPDVITRLDTETQNTEPDTGAVNRALNRGEHVPAIPPPPPMATPMHMGLNVNLAEETHIGIDF